MGIKEERLALPGQGGMVADELESFLGVPPGQRILHGRLLDDRLVSHERNWRLGLIGTVHVVAVRNAEIVVEPVPRRQELRMMPKFLFRKFGGGSRAARRVKFSPANRS